MLDKRIQGQIDQVFENYDRADTPGCAVGVVQGGELVYSRGYGLADLEAGTPITPETVFHLASVSKQFTAACIALLEEAGEFSLEDQVRKYVPFLPECGRELTLRHLVYMTNGLEDFYDVTSFIMGIPEGNHFSKEEAIRIIRAADWLKFVPGEEWSYGNTGYFLLGCIIERVTGMPFDAFVKQAIFKPLGMTHTFVRTDRFMDISHSAKGYARIPDGKGGFSFQRQNEMIEFGGAGQAWSSVADLVRWERNFFDNRLGGKDSRLIEKMSVPGSLNNGTATRYAYGQVVTEHGSTKVIYHEGGAAGVNTVIYRVPEKQLSVICLANTSDFLTAMLRKYGEECYERVAGIVAPWGEAERLSVEAKATAGTPEATTCLPAEVLEMLAGDYEDPLSSHIWEVRREGTSLQVLENYSSRFTLEMDDICEPELVSFGSREMGLEGVFIRSGKGPCSEIEVRRGDSWRHFQRFLDPPPGVSELKEYEGIYTCAALEAGYRVCADAQGVRLENADPERTLLNVVFTPAVRDMFLARYPPLIGWYVVQFRRDGEGKVAGFTFRDEVPGRERWVFERER